MSSKRDAVRMSEEELAAHMAGRNVAAIATNGPDGWPHVMALWYVMRGVDPWIWTYEKSQKVRNIERDPRATVMVEEGETYGQLRGAMLKTEAEIVRDFDGVFALGQEVYRKYIGADDLPEALIDTIRKQSDKRVAVRFRRTKALTWDHRKLGAAT